MKKALWILFAPILAILISAPVGNADDPVAIGHGEIFWELVTTTNVAAATTYYPSILGWSLSGYNALSIEPEIAGGVTMTLEISPSLSVRTSAAGAIGDIELAVRSTDDIEAGQILRIGILQQRNVVGINAASGRVVLDAALTSTVPNGTTVIINPAWIDITRTGYDAANYQYNQASYVNVTTIVDFDAINTMRVRIRSVTSDGTNTVRYRVKYR